MAASGSPFRDEKVAEALSNTAILDGDRSSLTGQHVERGVTTYISTWDKACGGDSVPLFFLEYEVPGARPVDVFNILYDQLSTPAWLCKDCSVARLGNWCPRQAVGYMTQYSFSPFEDRLFYQWHVLAANESTDPAAVEYLSVFTSDEDEELIARKSAPDDVVVAQNCLFSYRMRGNGVGGTRVAVVTLSNIHLPLGIPQRQIYDEFYVKLIDKAVLLREHATEQSQKGLNETTTTVPDWMLYDVDCQGVDAEEGISQTASATQTDWEVWVAYGLGVALVVCWCLCCCLVAWALCRHKGRSGASLPPAGSSIDSDSDGVNED